MTAEQLKDSILLLAMQGKLETNCSTDVPIASVLKKIYDGKGRINPIDPEQIPYDIPENWKWARLEDITDNCDNPFADGPFGSNLKREHYTEKHEVRIIQLSNIGENGWRDTNEKYTTYEHLKTIERSKVNAGDIVIAKMMPAGRAIEVPMNDYAYVLSSDAVKFVAHPLLNKRFLLMAINSPVFREQVYSEVHGVTRVRTSLKKLKSYIVPLPPLEEQKRIVAKIEELMPFVEQYAGTSTKLNMLNATFPEMMKKSILQEAVQGKLVPQDPNDEPASLLLKKIAEEKKRLIKEGLVKKEKAIEPPQSDDIPFDIPDSWEWIRFGAVTYNRDSERIPLSVSERTKLKKIYDYYGASGVIDKVEKYLFDKPLLLIGEDGANLLNRSTPIAFIAKGKYWVNNHAHVIDMSPLLDMSYIAYYINSISLAKYVTGTAQPKMNQAKMNSIWVPIPPLAEQRRIVAKIEELLPIVKELVC